MFVFSVVYCELVLDKFVRRRRKFIDIVKATACALIPLVLIHVILVPLSYALILKRPPFLYYVGEYRLCMDGIFVVLQDFSYTPIYFLEKQFL